MLVTISGFSQPPSSISRSLVLQRNTPREYRGRVFSAFFVSRDVLFLIGMAVAGLADVIEIRLLIVLAAAILIGAAVLTQLMPGLGRPAAEWRRAIQLLRTAPAGGRRRRPSGPRRCSTSTSSRSACRPSALLEESRRERFVAKATVREADTGSTIVKQGDAGDAAYFILGGSVVAGTPERGRLLPLAVLDGRGRLLRRDRRADRQPPDRERRRRRSRRRCSRSRRRRSASVMDVPALSSLFLSTLTERLTRTQSNADLPRLASNDQEALRDLRTPKPTVEALPKSY